MIAVIFEALVQPGQQQSYLDAAAALRPHLMEQPGFVSIERFASLADPNRLLSLSFWADEAAVKGWRCFAPHRAIQRLGRERVFTDYRLRVAAVLRDYGKSERAQAPADSELLGL
jgi:heme-degrading monooxygenase HmoA